MKNYIGFRAGRTLGIKNGGVITYIKTTEAIDTGQLIAKSNSCTCKNVMLLLFICTVLQTTLQKNLSTP